MSLWKGLAHVGQLGYNPAGFSRAWCNRTWNNGSKLKEGRFTLDLRKQQFMIRMVKHWHRLCGEDLGAPFLETFKAKLDRALSNPIQLKMSLLMAGPRRPLKVPSTPKYSMILNNWLSSSEEFALREAPQCQCQCGKGTNALMFDHIPNGDLLSGTDRHGLQQILPFCFASSWWNRDPGEGEWVTKSKVFKSSEQNQ